MDSQIKSKNRVSDHGEVFTADREVNAMLDLVKKETERIDSRFLEPACGTGNFLVEILRRKMEVVKKKHDKHHHALIAVSSIYGIDILEDNVQECRQRLLQILNDIIPDYRLKFMDLLECNIIQGDTLTMKTSKGDPIIFYEWDITIKNTSKCINKYTLEELIDAV